MSDIRHTIDTARGRMAWLEAGAGWPVVLLHAFPLTADMWRPQLESVPEGWRFIAPDLSSAIDARTAERTIDDYARDVGALLDAMKIDVAVIGGLSMGGYVTFALFRQSPSLFSGMILADTRPQADTPQGRADRTAMRELLAREGPRAIADRMLPKLLTPRTIAGRPELVARVRAMIESNPVHAIDRALGAMATRPDSTADLPTIACATLVIAGEHDALTPLADADAMHHAIDRSVLVAVPGAGHLSNVEEPDAFSKALGDFLLAHL